MKQTVWPFVQLGDIAEFRNGINYNKASFGMGLKVVNVKDFQDRLIADLKNLDEINPDGIVREECYLKDGDIIFVRSNGNRELIGRSMLVKGVTEPVSHSAFSIKVRFNAKGALPAFYAYVFRTALIRTELSNRGGGTNISNLNQDILNSLQVPKPTLPTQRKVVGILSAYDDLIENNTRRIAILESMAQAIYREWLVEFRFPGHEKVKLVDSPIGRIPEAWEFSPLGNFMASLDTGKRPKGGAVTDGVPSIGAENILGVGRHNFQSEKYVPEDFFAKMKNGVVKDRDVAIYKDGAYIGRSSYFRDGFPYRRCCVNEHVFLLRTSSSQLTPNQLYLWLNQPDTLSGLRATNSNAAQPGLNQKSIMQFLLLVPDATTACSFDSAVEPMIAKIINLAKRNANLRATRDLLLSKLISGQLDVEDLDIDPGEAVTE